MLTELGVCQIHHATYLSEKPVIQQWHIFIRLHVGKTKTKNKHKREATAQHTHKCMQYLQFISMQKWVIHYMVSLPVC